ncbi:MAG: anthranilate synthase component [Caloramator sp.]|jgi:para-aminobenzoate synthetase component 1|uniref:aminodeoxychorismate synthase component I n=1 Tax=Caloramator sp. TaxID=1871330 RepID=UPI001D57AD98|nr:aminodeoxychorismate synthase component I [Caloramator sp.]MBZ4662881.1 anthranilate synthase component [Caloramator sp.]
MIRLDYKLDVFKLYNLLIDFKPQLLESSYMVKDTGDYSILCFKPKYSISYLDGKIAVDYGDRVEIIKELPLKVLDEYIKRNKELKTGLIFDGGFVGYLSYDFGEEIMGIRGKDNSPIKIPSIYFEYFEDYIVVDNRNKLTYIVTDDEEIMDRIKTNNYAETIDDIDVNLKSNLEFDEYCRAVERVREYIRCGDVYQVNISQQFYGRGKLNPIYIYSKFRRANYGPYNALIRVQDKYILSTSPEQFLRKRGDTITTRPIKGTVKKVEDKEENERLKRELHESEKCRSELLMIIDLERNDLSRICIPGTVKVESLFDVEEYSTVNHLVSTIQGKLLKDIGFKEIIEAMFPGGSITGAPKLRSMEVINEIEKVNRGIYTGCIGYISNNGNMDFNIAIRTAVMDKENIIYNVGGGIVWDSNPEDEYEETLHKGRAIYNSLVKGGKR